MRHLSRYLLGAADRRALRWTDSYSLHRIIYDLFADKGVRQGVSRVIILSDRLPRTPQRGVLETSPLPESFLQAASYQFEVVVNPVWRDNRSGRIMPVRGRDAIAAWFRDHAPRWGWRPSHGPH